MTRPTIIVKDTAQLKQVVCSEIKQYGPSCDLNHLDVSRVENMSGIFYSTPFKGNISQWNTSNVTDMSWIFSETAFNGDISNWNTSNVTNMSWMFYKSQFNENISAWNVAKLNYAECMFSRSQFNGDLSKWNALKLLRDGSMDRLFEDSVYSGDLSHWVITAPIDAEGAFSPAFKGILPVSSEPINRAFYTTLFGSAHKLGVYLRTPPFGGAHFDILRLSSSKPTWAQPEDYKWARQLSKMGEVVGMSDNELRTYGLERYAVRDAINKTNQDAYSVLQNL